MILIGPRESKSLTLRKKKKEYFSSYIDLKSSGDNVNSDHPPPIDTFNMLLRHDHQRTK